MLGISAGYMRKVTVTLSIWRWDDMLYLGVFNCGLSIVSVAIQNLSHVGNALIFWSEHDLVNY